MIWSFLKPLVWCETRWGNSVKVENGDGYGYGDGYHWGFGRGTGDQHGDGRGRGDYHN